MNEALSPMFTGIIQRLISALLLIVSFFTPAKPENVMLRVVSASAETVVIEFKNETGRTITPEQLWLLEKQTEQGWEAVPFAADFAWNDIAEICRPNAIGSRTIHAGRCFGAPLRPGVYRFSLSYVCNETPFGGGEPRTASIVFEIT